MSGLFGNHIVGFPTRWLKYSMSTLVITMLVSPPHAKVTFVLLGGTQRLSHKVHAENTENAVFNR